jgi:hypothetical protein
MIPLPWLILAVTLLVGAAGATGYWQGGKHKANAIEAQAAREAALIEKARDAAIDGAAQAIAAIEVKNTTIRQKVEVQTREVPIYRECRHTADTLSLLNDALAGRGAQQPAGGGKLPGPDATGG